MKRKINNKTKHKKFLILLFIFFIIIFSKNDLFNHIYSNLKIKNNSDYKIIKQDSNNNYSGIGQEKVKNKDGYFTTFTTTQNNQKTYIEYKQNNNSPWSNNSYWGGNMADNGCGITAIAVILSGYNLNYTPEDLRQKYYPVLDNENISKELKVTEKKSDSES